MEKFTIKERYEGFQTLCGVIKDNACHFLTMLSIAEEERFDSGIKDYEIDLIDAVRVSQKYKWFDQEFYGNTNQLKLLEYYTGKHWTRREVKNLPTHIKQNEYTEAIYYNKDTKFEHFRRRSFDTLVNSRTVREGVITRYYIYACEE